MIAAARQRPERELPERILPERILPERILPAHKLPAHKLRAGWEPSRARQSGAVLIMALLIVAVVAGLATSMGFWFQLTLARGENRWHGAQAEAYLQGAESLAAYLLQDDYNNSKVDHLGENWAREGVYFPVNERGDGLTPAIGDAQARLNLNSLATKLVYKNQSNTPDFAAFSPAQQQFVRLLQSFDALPVSEAEAVAILEAVVDWIDRDSAVSGQGGAELYEYQQMEPAYHPANQYFYSVSELRLVQGVSAELYQQLEPMLVALPEPVSLNLNTAPLQLLRTLGSKEQQVPLSLAEAESLDAARQARRQTGEGDKQGFASPEEFFQTAEAEAVFGREATLATEGLTVTSHYFQLQVEAAVARQRRTLVSLLQRSETGVKVVGRSGL